MRTLRADRALKSLAVVLTCLLAWQAPNQLATSAETASGPAAVPAEGLRYAFDGDVNDSSSLKLPGEARGQVAYQASPIGGQAATFDGKSAVFGPSAADMDLSSQEFTLAVWIKPKQIRQSGLICLGGYAWRKGWLFDMHPDGSLRLELSTPEGKHFDTLLSGSGAIKPDVWTHVAAIVRAGENPEISRLYVNGFEVAAKKFKRGDIINPRSRLMLGGIENASAPFVGQMDEVRFFARVISDKELAELVEPGKQFADKPSLGEVNWQGVAPWANQAAPTDRFADAAEPLPREPFIGGKFSIRPNESIVVAGSAMGVFAQQQGYLETLLVSQARERKPTFRWMCWEGDTVYEQWRAMNFGGWNEQFLAVGASTIFLWFGQVEALDETKTTADFEAAYGKLLDEFAKATPRLVVISPPPFEKPPGKFMPDNTPRNVRVREHAAAARRLAEARQAVFVDLYEPLSQRPAGSPPLTSNGMHFTPEGQRLAAEKIAAALGFEHSFTAEQEPLRALVGHKNRLWFDCWRTMNWYFAYGDRTQTAFDKPAGGRPSLAKELEQYKPLIRHADARIHALALGQAEPVAPDEVGPAAPQAADTPHDPADEQKTFKLRQGFDVNLFASERDGLIKPLQMVWDSRGRLWALCAPSYPQLIPGTPANDFILVCEDTDHDGRADRFFRFAEGLIMPTGMALGDSGVYVAQGTQLLHLADDNADDRADRSSVVLSGFGTGDSHQCINSLCWGPDGRLWFTQGLHIFSLVETPRGLSRCHKTGIWRFNPRTLELHNFLGNAAATENAWGVGFDDWGQTFYTPGNEPGAFYIEPALVPLPIEQIAYGQYREIGRLAMSSIKGMRTEFFGSSHLPDDLQGVYVKSVYIAGFVELHRFEDDGAGFKSQPLGNLIASPAEAFRPLETNVGPDGAIYICDWYNPIIGHYQASYRDPRRDHSHGRIWRMTARGNSLVRPPKMATTHGDGTVPVTAETLLEALGSNERWVREQARHELAQRDVHEVLPALDRWMESTPADAKEFEACLVRVVGIYAAHETPRRDLLVRLLAAKDARARAFGAHMIGLWADRLDDALALVAQAAVDPAPRVRMEAIVSASYLNNAAAIEAAASALSLPRDRFIDYAFKQSVKSLKPYWYPALVRGELKFEGRAESLRAVLEADGTRDVAKFLRDSIEAVKPEDMQARDRLLALLVQLGSSDDLRYVLSRGAERPVVLAELAAVARASHKSPAGELEPATRRLLSHPRPELRAAGVSVAGAWGLKSLISMVRERLADSDAVTVAASAEALAELAGKESLRDLAPLVSANRPFAVQAGALDAIASFDMSQAAALCAKAITWSATDESTKLLLAPIWSRKAGPSALAAALANQSLTEDQAKLVHRAMSSAGQSDAGLIALLNKTLGVELRRREYDPAWVRLLAAASQATGDAERGAQVYQSKLANCAACHKLAGLKDGGDVGPDLSNVGKSLSAELLVESVVWPNRQVKEGFLAVRVVNNDGQVLTGYKLREEGQVMVLRDIASGRIRRLASDEIDEVASAGSVMPEGLAEAMTRDELLDLVRFLSEQGKAK